jgi:flagellar biosynthetic protein FliP
MLILRDRRFQRAILVFLLATLACFAAAQNALPIPKVSFGLDQGKSSGDVSSTLQVLALLTVLSLAPAILILTTAFSRIVIILSFLRSALGTPSIPPNQIVIGLSLFLTVFVMGPTYGKINDHALKPYLNKEIPFNQAVQQAESPLRDFMLKNTYQKDLLLFVNMRKESPKTREDISMLTLVPAFVISELKTAFIVGFYIFIPFLIIDLIVASGLMSMGMMMLPPTVVSLPAKILVFVLADGWNVIAGSIMQGYR